MASAPLHFPVIKRYRQARPVPEQMGGFGLFAGLTLVLLNTGNVLEYSPHFFTGRTIVVLLIATYKISRDIKVPDYSYRTPHFVLGIASLCLYLVNVMIGIGVLL